MIHLFPNTRLFLFLFFLFLLLGSAIFLQYSRYPHSASLTFFDVPGDAIFFEFPSGHKVLIDGGNTSEIVSKISRTIPFWDRDIDILIVTHTDKDHLFGAYEILKQFHIKTIFISGVEHNSNLFHSFLETVHKKNIPLIFAHGKTDFRIENTIFDIVFPESPLLGQQVKSVNNSSITMRITFEDEQRYPRQKNILLPGDIEAVSEEKVMHTPVKLSADILKAGHHGSKTSSREDFLQAISPKKVIITANKGNRFNHPHQEVLDRLKQMEIEYRITGEEGDIEIPL